MKSNNVDMQDAYSLMRKEGLINEICDPFEDQNDLRSVVMKRHVPKIDEHINKPQIFNPEKP